MWSTSWRRCSFLFFLSFCLNRTYVSSSPSQPNTVYKGRYSRTAPSRPLPLWHRNHVLSGFLPFSREEPTFILYKVNGIRVCNWRRGANWTCEGLSGTRAQDRDLRSLFPGYIDLGDDRDRYDTRVWGDSCTGPRPEIAIPNVCLGENDFDVKT